MVAIKEKSAPEKVAPYLYHGVNVDWKNPEKAGSGQLYAMGDCPICGKDDKFHIEIATGNYGCFKCNEKGTVFTFLRWLQEASLEDTEGYKALSEDKKFLNGVGLVSWGVCRSILLPDTWLIPGYSVAADTFGNLCQLYKYHYSPSEGRMVGKPTPGIGHYMHGVNTIDREKKIYFICEGWADGVALWEIMSQAKTVEGGLATTSNIDVSLLADANVVAIPTASVFLQGWCSLFAGSIVNLMLDNDHESVNKKTGKPVEGAGLMHTKRIARMLQSSATPPDQINWLAWSEVGYNKELPDGYDVRDVLSLTEEELQEKVNAEN